jgi:tRNA(Ile)-lysidine synthase
MPAIDNAAFEALMEPLGPFEEGPRLAVAVSGGADSMALTLLADAWARRRGGAITALTVDHRLRAESAQEARQVGVWLFGKGIAHQTLRWRGAKPGSGIQAAAREARYGMLAQWCRRQDVLHLLTAHHGDDQAETIMLRRDRGSGPDGLSGMAPVRALPGVRLLRPLLARRRADLAATLAAMDQPWLEDPSNQETRFARVRARRALAGEEMQTQHLLEVSDKAAARRRLARGALAGLAARGVRLHPAGYCWFDPTPCLRRDAGLLAPLLGDILRCIGGGIHRPRRDGLERLCHDITAGRLASGRTLAGARVLPRAAGLLVCREPGRLPDRNKIGGGKKGRWDRFTWALSAERPRNLFVGALGEVGWRQVRDGTQSPPPAPVRAGLPALWRGGRVLAVPGLELTGTDNTTVWRRDMRFSVRFSPPMPLQPDGLVLV